MPVMRKSTLPRTYQKQARQADFQLSAGAPWNRKWEFGLCASNSRRPERSTSPRQGAGGATYASNTRANSSDSMSEARGVSRFQRLLPHRRLTATRGISRPKAANYRQFAEIKRMGASGWGGRRQRMSHGHGELTIQRLHPTPHRRLTATCYISSAKAANSRQSAEIRGMGARMRRRQEMSQGRGRLQARQTGAEGGDRDEQHGTRVRR
jgi:hypothetical protein